MEERIVERRRRGGGSEGEVRGANLSKRLTHHFFSCKPCCYFYLEGRKDSSNRLRPSFPLQFHPPHNRLNTDFFKIKPTFREVTTL